MFIDNIDALKLWLSESLASITDADPQTLARYVIALLKKDKPVIELKEICNAQLEIFLKTHTTVFVDKLLKVLETKAYLPKVTVTDSLSRSTAEVNAAALNEERSLQWRQQQQSQLSLVPSSRDAAIVSSKNIPDTLSTVPVSSTILNFLPKSEHLSKQQTLLTDEFRDVRKRTEVLPALTRKRSHSRSPVVNRKRSHSRSPIGSRKRSHSRSPVGGRKRSRSPFSFRRRSSSRSPGRLKLRRSRSPVGRRRSRSRSGDRDIRRVDGRYRDTRPWNRNLLGDRQGRYNRSRSRSASPRSRSRHRSRSPNRRTISESVNQDQKGISQATTSTNDGVESPNPDNVLVTQPLLKSTVTEYTSAPASKLRCRDYDEKGFCLRGDLCQFDHGTDPVVVDDLSTLPYSAATNNVSTPACVPPVPPNLPVPVMPPFRPTNPIESLPLRPPPITAMFNPELPPPGMIPRLVHLQPPRTYQPHVLMPAVASDIGVNRDTHHGDIYQTEAYNPEAPAMQGANYWGGQRPIRPTAYQPQRQRDLVTIHPVPEPSSVESHNVDLVQPSVPVSLTDTVSRFPLVTPVATSSPRFGFVPRPRGPVKSAAHRPRFDYNRLGSRRPINTENSTLEIRKIPPDMNKMDVLLEHFKAFGTVVNLQVCYEGDPEGALISFSSNAEANAAHKSSAPVLNNRFIKVFWHNKQPITSGSTGTDTVPVSSSTAQSSNSADSTVVVSSNQTNSVREVRKPNVKDRLEIPPVHQLSLNNLKKKSPAEPQDAIVVSPSGSVTKTVVNFNALKMKKETASPVVSSSVSVINSNTSGGSLSSSAGAVSSTKLATESKHPPAKKSSFQETLKLTLELQKRKQQLLEKQIEQQKLLLAKLEKKTLSADDRAIIMKTLKSLTENIGKLQLELKNAVSKPIISPVARTTKAATTVTPTVLGPSATNIVAQSNKNKQQAQKAILDTELEIINKQYEGADTSELYQKVFELKKEAASLGLLSGNAAFLAGSRQLPLVNSNRRRSKSRTYSNSLSVDNRPKQIKIVGFALEEKASMLRQLKAFGEVDSFEDDEEERSIVVKYKTRQDAEQALHEATRAFSDRMTVSWFRTATSSVSSNPDQDVFHSELDNGDHDGVELEVAGDTEVLLTVEDEDDIDGEERSWRR